MTGGSSELRRTTPDTEPQASQAARQARRAASWLRDEAVSSRPTSCEPRAGTELGQPRARSEKKPQTHKDAQG